jgi:hypothetical protein
MPAQTTTKAAQAEEDQTACRPPHAVACAAPPTAAAAPSYDGCSLNMSESPAHPEGPLPREGSERLDPKTPDSNPPHSQVVGRRETGGGGSDRQVSHARDVYCRDCRMPAARHERLECEPNQFYCPICAAPVPEALVCPHCGSLICAACGTPLESADDLGIG